MTEGSGAVTPESANAQAANLQAKAFEATLSQSGVDRNTMVPNNMAALANTEGGKEMKKMMEQAIAHKVLSDMRRHGKRMREIIRKARHGQV